MKPIAAGLVLLLLVPASTRAQSPVRVSLDSAMALARETNLGLGIARQRVIEARNRSRGRWTNYLPRVATEATFSQVEERQALAIPPGAFGVLNSGEPVPRQPVRLPQGGTSLFFASTTIEQPVTQLFKIRAGHLAAVAEAGVTEAGLVKAERDVLLGVEQVYYGLLVAARQRAALLARVEADSAAAHDARGSVEVGLTLGVAAGQADARLSESRRQLQQVGYQLEDLSADLNDFLGTPAGTTLALVEPDAEAALGVDLADYLGSPIERHPEMVAATLQFERAAHAVAAARAEYLPNVGVYAQHFYQRALPFVPPSQFSFGVKLEWTIWDFRQRGYALAERQAQREQGRLEVERVRRRLESEVAKASRSVHRAQEGVAVAAETLAARREAERLAADQQGAGIVLPAVALAAVAARLQSEADLLQAQLGVRLAVAVLKRAAGRDR